MPASSSDFIEIRIASTEVPLKNAAVSLCSLSTFEHLQLAEAPMDVGDIGIYYFQDANAESKLLFLFERKTKSDLYASFVDHRYQEQSLRLATHPDLRTPRQVLYLLECPPSDESRMSQSDKIEWYRTQASLLAKPGHDFLVAQTKSTEESALLILSFASKCLEIIRSAEKHSHLYPEMKWPYFLQEEHSRGFTPLSAKYVEDKLIENTILQTKKQGNMTPKMFFVTTVGCIPTIGPEMAKAVVSAFPGGLLELLQKATDDSAGFVQLVGSLKFGSTKRQSSIGKNRAEQILRFLCPQAEVAIEKSKGKQEAELEDGDDGHENRSRKHLSGEEEEVEEAPSKKKTKKAYSKQQSFSMEITW